MWIKPWDNTASSLSRRCFTVPGLTNTPPENYHEVDGALLEASIVEAMQRLRSDGGPTPSRLSRTAKRAESDAPAVQVGGQGVAGVPDAQDPVDEPLVGGVSAPVEDDTSGSVLFRQLPQGIRRAAVVVGDAGLTEVPGTMSELPPQVSTSLLSVCPSIYLHVRGSTRWFGEGFGFGLLYVLPSGPVSYQLMVDVEDVEVAVSAAGG